MKQFISKKTLSYISIVALVILVSGFILFPVVTNFYVLLAVLIIEILIFSIMIFFFFDKYVKPIENSSDTMDKLLQGNYHARVHHAMNGTIGELNMKINSLARNLSELTIQEQIQAEQLSTVIENSESGLVLIDEKGYIHIVNRTFTSMFGKRAQDYIGYLYYEVLENEQIHHTVQETFLYEKHVKHLFSIPNEQGTLYLEIVGAPIFNERNMLKGAVLVIYDITEFKHVEVMRKDFVANVSHELKTPITSIKGFAETLMEGAAEDEKTRNQFLQIIYDESHRIQLLIDDLLILSSLEKDDMELNISNFQVETIVDEILPIIDQQAKSKSIHLNISVDKQIGLHADEEKLKQILLNLLMNAVSYTRSNGKVSLKITEDENYVCFMISDSGIGIEKADLPRIFERFYRVDKARSRDTGGTGLGLAIVKHIVEVHNGEITVDSEVDKGTTFKVYIPKYGQN